MTTGPEGALVFPTAIGRCGIAWRDRVVTRVLLPDAGTPSAIRLLARRPTVITDDTTTDDLAEPVRGWVVAITALLAGERVDLGWIPIDVDAVGDFERAVYGVTRSIPPGSVLTYGEVAIALGDPGAARAVGRALGANPWPIVVPCHRVMGAGGKLTGFSAPGGVDTKRRMLLIEGCPAVAPSLFD